jgi:GH43 family beta-xylosidase
MTDRKARSTAVPAAVCAIVFGFVQPIVAGGVWAAEGPFLFSYFKGNGEDGLHLACSEDGLEWEPLRGDRPFLTPQVGGKLMRDPSIVQGDDGVFHMVWSSGWWDRGFGYASSKDLIHWSEQVSIPVNERIDGAKNTWAPDLFFDATSKQFVIVFATTVPGRFPETDGGGDKNHRLYAVTTRDFQTFSVPKLLMNPGYNSIDGTLFAADGRLGMIYKDERPGHKRLHVAFAPELDGPWAAGGQPILERDWVEGPAVLRVGSVWRVYFDCYTKRRYGAAESADGLAWRDITDEVRLPEGARHGTAFPVSRTLLESLR